MEVATRLDTHDQQACTRPGAVEVIQATQPDKTLNTRCHWALNTADLDGPFRTNGVIVQGACRMKATTT